MAGRGCHLLGFPRLSVAWSPYRGHRVLALLDFAPSRPVGSPATPPYSIQHLVSLLSFWRLFVCAHMEGRESRPRRTHAVWSLLFVLLGAAGYVCRFAAFALLKQPSHPTRYTFFLASFRGPLWCSFLAAPWPALYIIGMLWLGESASLVRTRC